MDDTLSTTDGMLLMWLQPFFSTDLSEPVVTLSVASTDTDLGLDAELQIWQRESMASWELVDRLLDEID